MNRFRTAILCVCVLCVTLAGHMLEEVGAAQVVEKQQNAPNGQSGSATAAFFPVSVW